MPKPAHELDDEDFYARTQDQVAALRACKGHNRLDIDPLAEEVEDLGTSDLHAVESVEQIMAQLLKLDHLSLDLPRNHWRAEIEACRASLERRLTGSLEDGVNRDLERRYERTRRLARVALIETEPGSHRRFPTACPYDRDAILRCDVFAEAGILLQD